MKEKAYDADTDASFMREALKEAEEAFREGEVPVGAVLVMDGRILSRGHNEREGRKNALLHAEIVAIDRACREKGSWRLDGGTLYVTLEPCPMCAGAILNARISRVVFGAWDASMGAMGSVLQMNAYPLPFRTELTGGILEEASGKLLQNFFQKRREGK